MNLQQKIEAEIDRLEKELEKSEVYAQIKECEVRLEYLKDSLKERAAYTTLQTLKNLLSETSTQDYKILDRKEYTTSPRRAPKIKLADSSHYKEMLDFIEALLEDSDPRTINDIFQVVTSANYEVGGKKPPYTLSAILSKDQRFTPTNKGWILTKKVNEDAI